MLRLLVAALATTLVVPTTLHAEEASLQGSRYSMVRQNRVARNEAYEFLRTPAEVLRTVQQGDLVQVAPNDDFELSGVSFPFARPEVRLFVERFAVEYRAVCDEPLVVTSLTRPRARQPRNASPLSVHPAGMAVDLRVPRDASCRSWLEARLLDLESDDLLDVTRERHPPHYHVALFPSTYRAHMEAVMAEEARLEAAEQARQDSLAVARLEAEQAMQVAAAAAPTSSRGFVPFAFAGLPLLAFALSRLRREREVTLPRHRRPPTI